MADEQRHTNARDTVTLGYLFDQAALFLKHPPSLLDADLRYAIRLHLHAAAPCQAGDCETVAAIAVFTRRARLDAEERARIEQQRDELGYWR